MKRAMRWLGGLAMLAYAAGCGPIQYYSSILDADGAAKSAKEMKAWEWACFEYYAALTYIKKAMEEAGYADYEAAHEYAKLAATHAKEAARLTQLRKAQRKTLPVVCKERKDMEKKYIDEAKAPSDVRLKKTEIVE